VNEAVNEAVTGAAQALYESRFASTERLIGFFALFHAMAAAVAAFFPAVSLGCLGYDMSRSQSMLRVATTASPVSGSEVRERILELEAEQMRGWSVKHLQRAARAACSLRHKIQSKARVLAARARCLNL